MGYKRLVTVSSYIDVIWGIELPARVVGWSDSAEFPTLFELAGRAAKRGDLASTAGDAGAGAVLPRGVLDLLSTFRHCTQCHGGYYRVSAAIAVFRGQRTAYHWLCSPTCLRDAIQVAAMQDLPIGPIALPLL